MEYNDCLLMIMQLGDELENLKKNEKGILFLDIDDIYLKDDKYQIKKSVIKYNLIDNEIIIDKPFNVNNEMAPELRLVNEIPSKVNYNVCFYNLKNIALKKMELENLEQLNPTKLYFLLKRCSAENANYRTFFYL